MEHAHEEQHFRKLVDSFVKCTTTILLSCVTVDSTIEWTKEWKV